MAVERVISPGIFTSEKDLSFLPTAIQQLGAAIVGPTVKGPAFVPTIVESQTEFTTIFGPSYEKYYTPATIKSYLKSAGTVTVVRVLGLGGYIATSPIVLEVSGSTAAILAQTKENASTALNFSIGVGTVNAFSIIVSGSGINTTYSCSLNDANANYITNIFGTSAQGSKEVYVYKNFDTFQETLNTADNVHVTGSYSTEPLDFTNDYNFATTPWVQSQMISDQKFNLFRVHSLAHGDSTNTELKIGIRDIKAAGSIAGTNYGSFTLIVRGVDGYLGSTDTDRRPDVRETWSGLSLDPTSPKFVSRVIGDRYVEYSTDHLRLNPRCSCKVIIVSKV